MLSYSIDYLFRSGITGSAFDWMRSFVVGRIQTVHYCGSISQCAVVHVPEWLKDRCLDLSYTSSTPPTSRSWSNRSGSVSICTRMIRSSMGLARYRRRLVWLAVPCKSSTRSKTGCRQTVFGWMLIRPSSFGWAQVTSSEIATRRRSTQSCRPPILWTISESTLTQLTLERQVSKLCQVCYFHLRRLRTVRRSLSKECLRTLVHAFVTSRVDHCNSLLYGSYSYLLDRLQSVLNSAARLVLISEHSKVQRNLGRHPWRTTLATNQEAYRVQNCSPGATLPRRRCARVLDWTVSSCQFCRRSAKPPVCFQRRPRHSSFPTPNIWFPSFCYLGPSALELTPIG